MAPNPTDSEAVRMKRFRRLKGVREMMAIPATATAQNRNAIEVSCALKYSSGLLTCHTSQDRSWDGNESSGEFGEDSHDNQEETTRSQCEPSDCVDHSPAEVTSLAIRTSCQCDNTIVLSKG